MGSIQAVVAHPTVEKPRHQKLVLLLPLLHPPIGEFVLKVGAIRCGGGGAYKTNRFRGVSGSRIGWGGKLGGMV